MLRACPVFYLHFLEEILLKKSWKTGKVLRWLDKLNFTRSSSRNIFSWFAVLFFTKFPLEKKSVFSHTCSGGSPVMNIFLPPITDLFYNFSRRIFSRKTHIERRLNSSIRRANCHDFRKIGTICSAGHLSSIGGRYVSSKKRCALKSCRTNLGGRKLF